MESPELLEVVSDGAASAEETRPSISPEEYKELITLRQQTLELKAEKSDVQDFVLIANQYVQQLQAAQQRLQALNDQINEAASALQARVKELVEPHGITGQFSISDTAPHYIIPAEDAVESPPAATE